MKSLLAVLLAVLFLVSGARADYVDARSQKVLADSAWAYGSMTTMRMNYEVRSSRAGGRTSGKFSFNAPNLLRLERRTSRGTLLTISNNAQVYEQVDTKRYRQENAPPMPTIVDVVWRSVPTQFPKLLGPLLLGQSPAAIFEMQKMRVTTRRSGNYNILRAAGAPGNGVWEMRFNAKDNLLYRLDMTVRSNGRSYTSSTILSAYQKDKPFPAGTYAIKPGKGMKKVAAQPAPGEAPAPIKVGGKPLPVYGRDLNGKVRNLSDYKGKIVLVDFWATWCGPCVAQIPEIKRLHKKYRSRGFEVLAVSLDQDKQALQQFIKQNKLPWPQIYSGQGPQDHNSRRYKVSGIPFTFLVGRDGRVLAIDPPASVIEDKLSPQMKGWI